MLHYAVDRGHLEMVEYLLDIGADINIKTEDEETPLHLGNIKLIYYKITHMFSCSLYI